MREKIKKRLMKSEGFTLVEVLIALAILAMGMLSVYTAQGNSMKAIGSSRNILIATTLAEKLINEKMIKIEDDIKRGAFPEDKLEEDGDFEEPFNNFRWSFEVRQVELPVIGDLQTGQPEATTQSTPSQTTAPESAQRNVAQIIAKKIGESVREIRFEIIWDELGVEKKINLTTHVVRL